MGMADRIKERRIAMDFTQEELAQKLGLQKSAIAKYEKGRVENIKRSIIEKMSELLDCSPAWLMGWDSIEEKQYIEGMAEDMKDRVYDFMGNAFDDTKINHMKHFNSLNRINQKKVISYTDNLLNVQKLEEEQAYLLPQAAHERTDIEVTDEMRNADDDIMNDDDFWKDK